MAQRYGQKAVHDEKALAEDHLEAENLGLDVIHDACLLVASIHSLPRLSISWQINKQGC